MGIKIGDIDASYFKVGSSDCKIYLGDTLLYPTTPTVKDYLRFVAKASGTFTKNKDMTQWTTGNNGIPHNWTVVDYSG